MKTIQILGGGLAGLSLGIGLRTHGVPVVLTEAGRYPRHRVCGEFIRGVSSTTLEALGVRQDLADAERLFTTSWFHRGEVVSRHSLGPDQGALGISRHRLDLRLARRFTNLGGRLQTGTRARAASPGEGIVDARGRVPRKGKWVGRKAHYLGLDMVDDLEMHLVTEGYVGLARVEEGRVNVCGLFRIQDGGTTPLAQACGKELETRLRAATLDEASSSGTGGFELGWQAKSSSEPGPTLGDRSAIIPPFTGNGMSMAFEDAELSLDPLLRYAHGSQGWAASAQSIRRRQRDRFDRRLRLGELIHPAILHPMGQRVLATCSALPFFPFATMAGLLR